jgi:probable phosphoglycerate mutase
MVAMADDERGTPDPPPTRVAIIRHGESNTTVARTVGGPRTCSGLSDLGRRQSERLAGRLTESGEFAGAHLYASHYPRAIETAELIAPALGRPPVVIDDGFGEHDPGPECDGLTFEEFLSRHGMPDWESDPFAVTFPGGETIAELHHRVGEALHRVTSRHVGETVVICCHGGVINAALRWVLRSSVAGDFELMTSNTSITEMVLVRPGRWRLLRYNDTAHLAGLPLATTRQ